LAPLPLDPEEQRLLTIYDQQTEQEQYEQAVAEWRRSEAKRRLVWQEALQQRQEAAVTERDQLADQLRTIHPALLTAAKPPSLDAKELERFLACSVERQR
jgi:squalene cyclase